jgi:ABC-type uncharacterized transport system substrate-binding protein
VIGRRQLLAGAVACVARPIAVGAQSGKVEGQNLAIEERSAAGRVDRVAALAGELVRHKVDVIVTARAGSALAASKVTSTVPIVFVAEPDPVGIGLVASLARPGRNVTGLADAHGELVPKRLELLKDVVRHASRVAVLRNPANASTEPQLKALQAAGRTLGLTVLPIEVNGPARSDVDRAFSALSELRPEALLVIADPTLGSHRPRIAELAIKHRLPTSGSHRAWVESGLLMSYGTDVVDLFRRGATLVDKILKGARPADLPVEEPTKFELAINLKTAKALDVSIPAATLARADMVVE